MPTVKTLPDWPWKGGTNVTPVPSHTNLMTLGFTSPTLQGSPGVPAPLYFQPVEPAGLPSPFQPMEGREVVIGREPPPTVSTIWSVPPSTVGSPPGRLKSGPIGFATIFARTPGL